MEKKYRSAEHNFVDIYNNISSCEYLDLYCFKFSKS